MLSPEDICRRAQTRYADFLRSTVNGTAFFPLPIRFGRPSPTEDFTKLRQEINALTEANLGCNIKWIEVNSRRWGKQRLPEHIEFADEASYLQTLGKVKEVVRFRENLALTRERCASLTSFFLERPLDTIEFADVWPELLEVCCYFRLHPRPDLYARELPLSVHSKFVECHQAILARLLEVILPPETVVVSDRFEKRFGLRFDEPQIRLRLLDKSLYATLNVAFSDITLPLSEFEKLRCQKLAAIVSENKMTFLTLPSVPQAIGIWGAGNAAALLHDITWLHKCQIIYWGDLDIQGLQILSRLRGVFLNTQSVLMDIETLNQFRTLCSAGIKSNSLPPLNLSTSEMTAWSVVQSKNLRLEQERLPAGFVSKKILDAVSQVQCGDSD